MSSETILRSQLNSSSMNRMVQNPRLILERQANRFHTNKMNVPSYVSYHEITANNTASSGSTNVNFSLVASSGLLRRVFVRVAWTAHTLTGGTTPTITAEPDHALQYITNGGTSRIYFTHGSKNIMEMDGHFIRNAVYESITDSQLKSNYANAARFDLSSSERLSELASAGEAYIELPNFWNYYNEEDIFQSLRVGGLNSPLEVYFEQFDAAADTYGTTGSPSAVADGYTVTLLGEYVDIPSMYKDRLTAQVSSSDPTNAMVWQAPYIERVRRTLASGSSSYTVDLSAFKRQSDMIFVVVRDSSASSWNTNVTDIKSFSLECDSHTVYALRGETEMPMNFNRYIEAPRILGSVSHTQDILVIKPTIEDNCDGAFSLLDMSQFNQINLTLTFDSSISHDYSVTAFSVSRTLYAHTGGRITDEILGI